MDVLLARLGMRMGTGPPEETGVAAFLPQPGVDPVTPLPPSTAARRLAGGQTLIVDAGGEDVIVVLDPAGANAKGADARQIWDFIQQHRTARKTGQM